MSEFRRLVRQIHRRSLWQVTLTYLGICWMVLEVAKHVTEQFALPDWTYGAVLVALLIGLPIVVATAVVQEGGPGTEHRETNHQAPSPHGGAAVAPAGSESSFAARPDEDGRLELHDVFRWRNAILGGATAGLVVALSVGVWYLAVGARDEASGAPERQELTVGGGQGGDPVPDASRATPADTLSDRESVEGDATGGPNGDSAGTRPGRADRRRASGRREDAESRRPVRQGTASEPVGAAVERSAGGGADTAARGARPARDEGTHPEADRDGTSPPEASPDETISSLAARSERVATEEDTATEPSPSRSLEREEPTSEPSVSRREADAASADETSLPVREITSATLSRLRRAIEGESLDSLRAVWVTLDAEEARNFRRFFQTARDIRVTFDVDWNSLRTADRRIELRSLTRWTYVSEAGGLEEPPPFEQIFVLENRGGSWVVVKY